MINNANKYTVSDIFGPDNNVKYLIPKFQREYSWGKENWDELLNDIWEAEGNHFIGSIICVNRGSDALLTQGLELIDGQQRLTTISLLFAAIYKLLKEKGDTENEDLQLELGNLKWRLLQKFNREDTKLELTTQNNNFQDYKSVLSDIGLREFNEENKNKGNRLIYKAFRFYLSRLEEYKNSELKELLLKLNNVLLVKIEVDSHSDAFMLFESLNNRGIPLSAIDLIKNKVLETLEKKGISIEQSFEKWKELIANLDQYKIQERFLRQYYNAFKVDDRIKIDGVTKATRSNLIHIYEKLIDQDVEYIFKDLLDKSVIYNSFYNTDSSEDELFISLKQEFRDLINVGAAPAYTLLLYIFTKEPRKDTAFYKSILRFMVKYFVRRNLTDFPNTRNLDQIFTDLITEIDKNNSNLDQDYIFKYFTHSDRMASDEMFLERLNGSVYDINTELTRFILSKIEEEKGFTKEKYVDFWQMDKSNKLVWTIEHVFPEGINIPAEWVNMIADGDKEKAKNIQDQLVHKLGNLTLSGFNQHLSNFNFVKKRDRKDSSGKYIGYKNGLYLNEGLKNKNEWTEVDIGVREKELVSIAFDLFKI